MDCCSALTQIKAITDDNTLTDQEKLIEIHAVILESTRYIK